MDAIVPIKYDKQESSCAVIIMSYVQFFRGKLIHILDFGYPTFNQARIFENL